MLVKGATGVREVYLGLDCHTPQLSVIEGDIIRNPQHDIVGQSLTPIYQLWHSQFELQPDQIMVEFPRKPL